MKKLLLSCMTLMIALMIPMMAYANEVECEDTSAWTENLAPGERVVAVYHETIKAHNEIVDNKKGNEKATIAPYEANLRWFATSKTSMGTVGGPWQYAGASTLSGGVLSASHTKTISNTFEGNLTVTVKDLTAFVGFDVTMTDSVTVGYHTDVLPKIEGKGYRLEYRHKYTKYKVKQEKKYDRRANTPYGTEYVYPMKWLEREYRVVEYTA